MKFQLLSLTTLILLAFGACSKDKTEDTPNQASSFDQSNTQFSGAFVATAGNTVQGKAKIVSNASTFTLWLDSFSITQGPDLKVYLSKKDSPFEFVNLGALKSNIGNSSYALPTGIDFSVYQFVLVYCQQYDHLFAVAQLKP